MHTIKNSWLCHFLESLRGTTLVKIISPFITDNLVSHLLKNCNGAELEIITRYNLNDFRSRVSSLTALKKLVKAGAKVKGLKGLHSKVYLFDRKCVIISSANFTTGGFFNNYEFGIKATDSATIIATEEYFNSLFRLDEMDLSIKQIEDWEIQIKSKGNYNPQNELPDFGTSPLKLKNPRKKYFIKFFGRFDSRVNLDFGCREMIAGSHCHFAVTFSGKKGRPRKYQTGDIIYMARMLYGRDYAIFGKAVAMQHNDKRDIASKEDIAQIAWKEEWPIYIRITNAIFIDGTMTDCPKMAQLIHQVSYESFDKTNDRYLKGQTDINPWDSLRQQADVQLSDIGAQWMEQHFQTALNLKGSIPDDFINKLYQTIYPKY